MKKILYAGTFVYITALMVSCTSDEDNVKVKSKTSKEVLSVKAGPDDDPIIVPPPPRK